MKIKKVRIAIEDKYVDVTLDLEELDDDEIGEEEEDELIASYAFIAAYIAGAITIDIQDIENEENCPEQMRLQ